VSWRDNRMSIETSPLLSVLQIDAEVAREIRQHARSSMSQEICGALIGTAETGHIIISARIEGKNASQGGAHVTFTQDTWDYIYKVKDAKFAGYKIVGWYHSHPGFGVFLSEYDLFIHQNFFNAPHQIAWVFDPHSDEEGCFGWKGEKIVRFENITVIDPKAKTDTKPLKEPDYAFKEPSENGSEKSEKSTNWVVIGSSLGGFVMGVACILAAVIYVPPEYFPGQWNSRELSQKYPQYDVRLSKPLDFDRADLMFGQPRIDLLETPNRQGILQFELVPRTQTQTSTIDKSKSK
jgi:proteasome lid subunit RPN8/RPN11